MESLKSIIEKIISNNLPGAKAHNKLAPAGRSLLPITDKKSNAAVLILIYRNSDSELCTVFMKRQEYDGPHSAQISFPGGKEEESDRNLAETALRESYEEIGIPSEKVEVIGKISELYIPVSSFLVHPYIGILQEEPRFKIDSSEVDYLITYPLTKLVNNPILYTSRELDGKLYKIPYFNIKNEIVWGATAMILNEFINVMQIALDGNKY